MLTSRLRCFFRWALTDPKYKNPKFAGCQALEQEVLTRGITFLMNENWIPGNSGGHPSDGQLEGSRGLRGAHLCSRFMNVALFREPIARIVSHRNYLAMLKVQRLRRLTLLEPRRWQLCLCRQLYPPKRCQLSPLDPLPALARNRRSCLWMTGRR